jgi:hypothetical protein
MATAAGDNTRPHTSAVKAMASAKAGLAATCREIGTTPVLVDRGLGILFSLRNKSKKRLFWLQIRKL